MKTRAKETALPDTAADAFQLEDFLPYRLAVASAHVSRLFTRNYAENFGLTIPEWRVLAVVGRFQTLSPSAAGEWTAMDKVKVSRASASLVSRGLLRQSQDPSDGRGRLLRLTRKGAALHAQVVPEALALEATLADGLSRAEWVSLNKALAKLNTHCAAIAATGEDDEE
ncbi:MAG: MarR family winged helix-turn-helix transcriptional regulator [Acetobacteraceae bacterium]|nr:MarR family winged helix-turn-helix transcriptional regulator [Acetobacteraceae bacterium]